jgi:hypothetical protein
MGHTPGPPAGMVAVSRDRFFSLLSADGRDIMPSHRDPHHVLWETRNREVWGWTAPGWKNPGAHPSMYAVVRSALGEANE